MTQAKSNQSRKEQSDNPPKGHFYFNEAERAIALSLKSIKRNPARGYKLALMARKLYRLDFYLTNLLVGLTTMRPQINSNAITVNSPLKSPVYPGKPLKDDSGGF